MISITLTDTDAIEYLKTQNPDIGSLTKSLETAMAYIDKLEEERIVITEPVVEKPSSRILRDTEIVKETESDYTNPIRVTWTEQELKVIEYAMSRPATELNRKFTTLVEKLARSASSVRSKLADMNLYVNDNIIYHK